MGKKSRSGSEMNNPDHISESLQTIFLGDLKYLNSLTRIRDRDGKNSDPESDPQHCSKRVNRTITYRGFPMLRLKVLSSEMDQAESRLTDRPFLKETSRRLFRKIRPSPIE
jgi:hypothetical protein